MTEKLQTRVIPPAPHPGLEGGHEELFDWEKMSRYAGLALGSVRRRPLLFLLVSGGMVLFAAAGVAVLPKTYEVQCGLLAQKNAVLAVRADNQMEQPTRAAAEIIIRRENLQALMRQTDLLQEWRRTRAPILRVKDWVLRALHLAPTEKELTEGLTDLLAKNLTVWTTADGAVNIRVVWRGRDIAYRLVDAAQQNFIEQRHVLEISTIAEQISILEGHAALLKKEIETQVAELQRLRDRSPAKSTHPAPPRPAIRALDPTALNLRVMLEGKRRAIADLEESRRRHIGELQTRLAEQRAVYSENHPALLDMQRSLDSLRNESPQLAQLRQEERELRRQLAERSDDGESALPGAPNIPADLFRDLGTDEDSSVEYARAQLQYGAQQYAGIRARIDATRIDLDTARAAFKYRYSVVTPPLMPRAPIWPKLPLVMATALIAGLVLALFATTFADLRSGVVLKRWQLEDLLGPSATIVDVHLPGRADGWLPPPASEQP
jgi:uncharacterized protein involved in exopolysaccharide biosynthesis